MQQKMGRFCTLYRIVCVIFIIGHVEWQIIKIGLILRCLEWEKKICQPLLSQRQAIIQDIKLFDLSDIVLDDNYPQYITSVQSKLEKRCWVVDDQTRIFCKLNRTRDTKGINWFLFEALVFLFSSVFLFVYLFFFFSSSPQ